ncbi:MAG: hypothetical protein LC749_19930, partial [Actinobacteria bacterium]|nr:hypothetical protein [Actinomycetota bacterium]
MLVGRLVGRREAPGVARDGRLSLVSSRPPSNRACGSPAHGSPTFFAVGIQRPWRYGRQIFNARPDRYGLISLNGTGISGQQADGVGAAVHLRRPLESA